MFERHSVLRYPRNTRQSLWRYFPADRLLDLIKSEELYFTHVPAFSDGFEGLLTVRTRDELASWFKRQNRSDDQSAWQEVEKYEEAQKEFYASCWHMNDCESHLMWKAYAERGFAVRTTFERVQASFESFSGSVTGGVVDYVDFNRDRTQVGNVFNLVMTKDRPYTDEREFRLLLWTLDPKNVDFPRQVTGMRVPVDVRMLVERVFVNPLEPNVPGELLAELERHKIPVDSSSLKYRSHMKGSGR